MLDWVFVEVLLCCSAIVRVFSERFLFRNPLLEVLVHWSDPNRRQSVLHTENTRVCVNGFGNGYNLIDAEIRHSCLARVAYCPQLEGLCKSWCASVLSKCGKANIDKGNKEFRKTYLRIVDEVC